MPYIPQEQRDDVNGGLYPQNAGQLQYVIASAIDNFFHSKEISYQTCNDVMGALAGAQQEFYRRVVAPYEDEKIKSNGDVYTIADQ